LNVSRVKVESLGGTLSIDTKPTKGTSFIIKLPMTMAIVQAILVGIADNTYCIPLSYIAETIKVSSRDIKTIEHHEMISYRDMVLPLVRLRKIFGFKQEEGRRKIDEEIADPPEEQSERSSIFYRPSSIVHPPPSITHRIPVVVVEVGIKKVGLIVDRFVGQQEIVIKPLTGILKDIKGVTGTTILGTGKAALIVDVGSLF
jgi:two-component system chemotaxis sensor kinase CheA